MSTSRQIGSQSIIEPVHGADPYVIASVNLRAFVADWVSDLESGGGQMRGLLEHARSDPQVGERYEYGAHYPFANIGPRATEPTATPEELLLFAVMAVYQDADFPGADRTVWDGEEAHVRRAFAYFHELGEQEAARRLRADVIRRSLRQRPPELEKLLRRSMNDDPARIAAHDRDMAWIDSRSFRAVELLDPDGDFDSELTALLP